MLVREKVQADRGEPREGRIDSSSSLRTPQNDSGFVILSVAKNLIIK